LALFLGISLSLIIVGVLLILVEIFLLPGFGIAGIPGLLALLGGVFLAADTMVEGVIYLLITILSLGLLSFILYKTGRLSKLWNKISLREKQNNEQGYVAPNQDYQRYLGKTGKALTLLRPAGSALIDGERVDVVTNGSFIQRNSRIKVIAVEGTRIIVAKEDSE